MVCSRGYSSPPVYIYDSMNICGGTAGVIHVPQKDHCHSIKENKDIKPQLFHPRLVGPYVQRWCILPPPPRISISCLGQSLAFVAKLL